MKKGTVKFYNAQKGFGFIKPEGGDDDIFVHSSGLRDDIRENDSVIYDIKAGQKGPNAINVQVVA